MATKIKLYTKNNLINSEINNGSFRVVYNIIKNVLGSQDSNQLYIDEISRSRTEIRIRPVGNSFPLDE